MSPSPRLSLVLALAALAAVPALGQPAVPAAYQSLYAELETKLLDIEASVDAVWDGTARCAAYSADLLAANTTVQKTRLLIPAIQGFAFDMLAHLDTLGVNAVRINIGYPILAPDFPDQPQYLAFYRGLVADARARGMTVFIKSNIVPSNATYGSIDPVVAAYMDGLTAERYRTEKRAMIEIVLAELAPDYYTVENEPTTMEDAIGLSYTPSEQEALVRFLLDGLDTGATKMGAGLGTWEDPEYAQRLVSIPDLDILDLHVYPIYGDLADGRLFQYAAMAEANGKGVAVGETWLYKQATAEIGAPPLEIYKRDMFDFWAPLDVLFVENLMGYAQAVEAELVTLYWGPLLFGTVAYQPGDEDRTPDEIFGRAFPVANQAMLDGEQSAVGQAYAAEIAAACIGSTATAPVAASGLRLAVTPNPTRAPTLRVEAPAAGTYVVTVTDALGRRVSRETHALAASPARLGLGLDGAAPGVYLVMVEGAGHRASRAFTVVR